MFLAMELVDGGTLADLTPPDGLPLDAVIKYAIPLADALGAAHAQGIAHRDLKPANVMVTKDGRVKVLDFGLAKLRDEMIQIDATMAAARALTGRGQIVGTVTDMSPEQAAGAAVDHRTDLFSLGVMLYEGAFASGGSRLLVYQAGKIANRLFWFDRQGRELESVAEPMNYYSARLSPDGSSVAMDVGDPQLGTSDIWIHDLKRGITGHFTNDKGTENTPLWSPDGRTLVYGADRHGPPHLHVRDVSGGDERQILPAEKGRAQDPSSCTPDGRWVLHGDTNRGAATEIFMAPIDGSAPPTRLVRSTAHATGGRVSPDGRWLSYVSDASGREEVYVRPMRADHPLTQVSRAGGSNIRWRADGRELFDVEGATRLLSADVPAAATFEAGAPRLVFTAPGPMLDYDVQADGQRFLVVLLDREAAAGTLSAILNWTTLLKKQ